MKKSKGILLEKQGGIFQEDLRRRSQCQGAERFGGFKTMNFSFQIKNED